jgi:hypothetical protein
MSFTFAAILPCFVPSATNRPCARIPGSKKPGETSMMMNDLREAPMPPAEMGSTPKIVAALVVALGFGAMGAYSYETGTWNSPPKQVVASKDVSPPAPLDNATPSDAALQSSADLPPAALPAPVKDVPATQAPAKAAAAAPPVRVARAQALEPALPQSPGAQPPAPAASEVAAPAANIPEPPAQNTIASPPVNTPTQEAPAQEAPAQATPEPQAGP